MLENGRKSNGFVENSKHKSLQTETISEHYDENYVQPKARTIKTEGNIEGIKFKKKIQINFSCIIQSFKTIENLSAYLRLPEKLDLKTYVDSFLKRTKFNRLLGIKLFFKIKQQGSSELDTKKFLEFLDKNADNYDTTFRVGNLIYVIDNEEKDYLALCLETIPFHMNGVSTFELRSYLKKFFPTLVNELIIEIIKELDQEEKGMITYNAMINFLMKYTKKCSLNLVIKLIADYLEKNELDTIEVLSKNFLVGLSDDIESPETISFLKNMVNLTEDQVKYLIKNNTISLEKIIKEVDFQRQRKKILSTMVSNKLILEPEEIEVSVEEKGLLDLGIDYADINEMEMTLDLKVSIVDFYRYIKRKVDVSFPDESKRILKKVFLALKSQDPCQTGMINYVSLFNVFKFINPRFHLEYITNKILIKFNGDIDAYLQYKNIDEANNLSKEEYDFLFLNEEMLSSQLLSNELFDFFQTNRKEFPVKNYISHIKYTKSFLEFHPLSDEEKQNVLINEISSFEEKHMKEKAPFYIIYNSISLTNPYGKVLFSLIFELLDKIIQIPLRNIYVIIGCFINRNFTLFDLLSFTKEINKYTHYKLDIEGIIDKIRDKGEKLDPEKKKFNLVEFANYFNKEFNISLYEAIMLFNQFVDNPKNSYRNVHEIDIYSFLELYEIDFHSYEQVKEEVKLVLPEIKSNQAKMLKGAPKKEKKDKSKKDDPLIKNAFKKFAYQVRVISKNDLHSFFEEYDLNHNGLISRDELLNILDTFKILNENEKIQMLNYADKQNLDDISIGKFINIINSVKFDDEEYKKLNDDIKEKKSTFETKIPYEKFKKRYLYNKKLFDQGAIEDNTAMIIKYKLQEELYNKFPSFEKTFFEADEDKTGYVSINDFKEILQDIFENIDIKYGALNQRDFIELAFEKTSEEEKKKLKSKKKIPYDYFVGRIARFKIPKELLEEKEEKEEEKEEKEKKEEKKKKEIPNLLFNNSLRPKTFDFSNFLKLNRKLDLNNPKDVLSIKTSLLETFSFCGKKAEKEIKEDNMTHFQNYLLKISKTEEKGIDYTIKDEDYFEFLADNGVKKSGTIFNSEIAAMKKCSEIYENLHFDEQFFDEEFGSWPEDKDPSGKMNKSSIYYNMAPKGQVEPNLIKWYRTNEISKSPQFLTQNTNSSEVVQGALGDCWFLSALAAIATKDYLIRGEFDEEILEKGELTDEQAVMLSSGVYPPIFHYFRTKGIYCFRFYKNYKWRYVVIDDRLPCMQVYSKNKRPKLLFGKCRNVNEFWVALIEKAYAKLHGCYEALVSGCIDDGIKELTGESSARISLELLSQHKMPDDFLWELIKKCALQTRAFNNEVKDSKKIPLTKNNSVMVCAVEAITEHQEICFEDEKVGMLFNHGYPIISAFEIPKSNGSHRATSRLILLKNSWGFKTWNGKWSRNSEEYEKNKEKLVNGIKEVDPTADLTDKNTFFMCFSDFRKVITKLYFGIDFFPEFVGFYFDDKWSDLLPKTLPSSSVDNFFNNPQYYVKIEEDTSFYANIVQEDGRLNQISGNFFPFKKYICQNCIVIIKTDKGKERLTEYEENNVIFVTPIRIHKENSLHFRIKKGEYILIPCNSEKGKAGKFRLNIFVRDKLVGEYNTNDFMDHLQKVYVERLINPNEKDDKEIPPVYINENSKAEYEIRKKDYEKIITYQLKNALNRQKEGIINENIANNVAGKNVLQGLMSLKKK